MLAKPLSDALAHDFENVDMVEPNNLVKLDDPAPSAGLNAQAGNFKADDPYMQNQWFAERLDYNAVYDVLAQLAPKRKAKVAILDTGIDKDHEDLSKSFGKSPADRDAHGHGTHCAGLAGAVTNNKTGIASLNWEGKYIEVMGFAALGDNGSGSNETIAQSIIDAAEANADVISLSLGGFAPLGPANVLKKAVAFAQKRGAIVVVAAGNSNGDAKNYSPANVPGVICVAAVDDRFAKASFSNTNTSLDMPIAAPGVNIFSLNPKNKYVAWNGTSMATPLVAGLLGVMKSLDPNISTENAYKIINETGTSGFSTAQIGKVIQPAAALSTFK